MRNDITQSTSSIIKDVFLRSGRSIVDALDPLGFLGVIEAVKDGIHANRLNTFVRKWQSEVSHYQPSDYNELIGYLNSKDGCRLFEMILESVYHMQDDRVIPAIVIIFLSGDKNGLSCYFPLYCRTIVPFSSYL